MLRAQFFPRNSLVTCKQMPPFFKKKKKKSAKNLLLYLLNITLCGFWNLEQRGKGGQEALFFL